MTELIVEAEPVTIREVHPADVVLPDGTSYSPALVRVTQGRVYVWARVANATVLVWSSPHALSSVPREAQFRNAQALATEDGEVVVTRARGCGCSSPLKSFQPWTPDRRSYA